MPDLNKSEFLPISTESKIFSEDLNDVISHNPSWIIRWGISIYFALILFILIGSWYIHYPQTVSVPMTLNTVNSPKAISSSINGEIFKIFVKEGNKVKINQPLAIMQSNANYNQISVLRKNLDIVKRSILNENFNYKVNYFDSKIENFGELQNSYQLFVQAYLQYLTFKPNGFVAERKKLLEQDIHALNILDSNLMLQKRTYSKDSSISREEYLAQRNLFQLKVIPLTDYRKEQSKLIAKRLLAIQSASAIVQNERLILSKRLELLEIDRLSSEQKKLFLQQIDVLRSAIDNWDNRYVLRSPVSGVVSFSSVLEDKEYISANSELFYVDPNTSIIYGQTLISPTDIGQVKINQAVIIRVNGYSEQIFGSVNGKVKFISRIANKLGYFLVKIELPNGLKTTYHENIPYRKGITASANIITDNPRVLTKIFINFRKIIHK